MRDGFPFPAVWIGWGSILFCFQPLDLTRSTASIPNGSVALRFGILDMAVAVAAAGVEFRLLFGLGGCNSNASSLSLRRRRCCCCCLGEGEREGAELPGRQRRQLRQQRREAKSSSDPLVANWREHLEDRLLLEAQNYKKLQKLRRDSQFSINSLSSLGPQWWALHVSPHRSPDTATSLSSSLSASFPHLQFKLYNPCVSQRLLLKDGFIRFRHRPLQPGTMYLHCTLNRQLHHLVESSPGVIGFRGSQIVARDEFFTKPKPVSPHEIDALLLQEKEEQQAADKAFQEKQAQANKPPRSKKLNYAYFLPGVTVRLLSGPFADYTASLKELNVKKKRATVELLLFGKESTVELNIDQIEAVTAASEAK